MNETDEVNDNSSEPGGMGILRGHVAVIVVYVREAHAMDVWPLKSSRWTHDDEPVVVERTATCTQERVDDLQNMLNKFPELQGAYATADIVEEGDRFCARFRCWPTKYFTVSHEGTLMHAARTEIDKDTGYYFFPRIALEHALTDARSLAENAVKEQEKGHGQGQKLQLPPPPPRAHTDETGS